MANISIDMNLNVSWVLASMHVHDPIHTEPQFQLRFALGGQHLKTITVAAGLDGLPLEGSTVLDLSSIDSHGVLEKVRVLTVEADEVGVVSYPLSLTELDNHTIDDASGVPLHPPRATVWLNLT